MGTISVSVDLRQPGPEYRRYAERKVVFVWRSSRIVGAAVVSAATSAREIVVSWKCIADGYLHGMIR
jgi:hypothetical protein